MDPRPRGAQCASYGADFSLKVWFYKRLVPLGPTIAKLLCGATDFTRHPLVS